MQTPLSLERVLTIERLCDRTRRRGAFHWRADVKVALVLLVTLLNVGLALPLLSGGLLAGGALLLCLSRPPWRPTALFLIVPLWPVLLTILGFGAGFGHTPLLSRPPLTLYREGLWLGGVVAMRVYCDLVWLALTTLTTPFADMLGVLRRWRLPGILIDTLAMMYRYAFLLHDEFLRLWMAGHNRGGRARYRVEWATLGRIVARLFMRAYDRSDRICTAMWARGGR